jgi:NAD(P)-dependent dehydrogenase (short-subunit alcohol dehydrogenase family)
MTSLIGAGQHPMEREALKKTFRPRLGSPASGVVVTGGASGIGLASAQALAAVGRPVALWDLKATEVKSRAQEIAVEFGVITLGLGVDVRDPAAIRESAAATRAKLPAIGGIVHCAGTVDMGSLEGITPENWAAGLDVHLRAIVLLLQVFLEDLRRQPNSAVVAIASINATLGNAMNPIYSAAKGGVLSLVRSLADRLARDGIRINSVSPGQIVTPMMQPALDALPGFFEKRILLARIGLAEEIGRVVRFLLSDEASYITAAEFIVDGGNISSQRT